jgi:predicted esterase
MHAGQPTRWSGAPLWSAGLVLILLHDRGASADDMLTLADELELSHVAFVAPQAAGHSWYPRACTAPLDQNEPALSSALLAIAELIDLIAHNGLDCSRVGLVGFSQGACLALEYAARHAMRYAGIAGLSGGLIGPPGTSRDYVGFLESTPVFLGCGDEDPVLCVDRVHETAHTLRRLGGVVFDRIYRHMDDVVNQDEIAAVHDMFSRQNGPL